MSSLDHPIMFQIFLACGANDWTLILAKNDT